MSKDLSQTAALAQRWDAVMMRNYGTPPIAVARGSGSRVWDVDGNEYLDLIAGIAVSSLGHCHPAVSEAVASQAHLLIHSSNLAIQEPALALAEELVGLLGVPGRVFFSQDGATANEAAIKIARKYGNAPGPAGARSGIVSTHGSFHGRTLGALAVTGNPAKREPFAPLPGPVDFVPYGDVSAMAEAVNSSTAAVIVEPVQGENGVVVPPNGYLRAVRQLCDDAGALMIVDEVQSGMGRAGVWFMSMDSGVRPDVVTLAKGVAAGMPLGVCIATGPATDVLGPGDHGSTFGGNPVSCAAALAMIDTVRREDVLNHVKALGAWLDGALDDLVGRTLAGHRGVGLWRGLLLADERAPAVETEARSRGFLVNAVRPDVIRLAPALTIGQSDLAAFLAQLPAIVEAAGDQ